MKKFKSLSNGAKIFVAIVMLLLAVVVLMTIVCIVTLPSWETNIFDGVFLSFFMLITIGSTVWFLFEILMDLVDLKD